ncbi:MAG: hypothetical protein V1661_01995 [bacterium]
MMYSKEEVKEFRAICPSHMLDWMDEQLSAEMQRLGVVPSGKNFTDPFYALTLKEMIAEGNYDEADSDIREVNFLLEKDIQFASAFAMAEEMSLRHFMRTVSTKEALDDIKENSLRPGVLRELLAYGKRYPDKQTKHPITALGSRWQNTRGYWSPTLDGLNGKRRLYLDWRVSDWTSRCFFLVVPI